MAKALRRAALLSGHLKTPGTAPLASVASCTVKSAHYGAVTPEVIAALAQGLQDASKQIKQSTRLVSDASHHPGAQPEVHVLVRSAEEVSHVMKVATRYVVPVYVAGGRTGLEGGMIPYQGGILLDVAKMKKVVSLNENERHVTVQPGIRKEALNSYLAARGFLLTVDPASNGSLGGFTSTGASGTLSVGFGTIRENVVSLEVVLTNGEIMRTRRKVVKSSAGYNLTQLVIGSEGTLCVVTEITIKVVRLPKHVITAQTTFGSIRDAANTVNQLVAEGVKEMVRTELLNAVAIKAVNAYSGTSLPEQPLLLLEFFGSADLQQLQAVSERARAVAKANGALSFTFTHDKKERDILWEARRNAHWASFGAHPLYKGEDVEVGPNDALIKVYGTDVCVPLSALARVISETEQEVGEVMGSHSSIIGHVADGNFHCQVAYNERDPEEVRKVHFLVKRLVSRALAAGGTCTGEHGIGIGKREGLKQEVGPVALSVMKNIKVAFDPLLLLNPGKVVGDIEL